ncbi:MAG: hypothetical protein OEY77_09080 [Nitrospira sp.]|nr:hypothetical protein [Nitrospira sp.]
MSNRSFDILNGDIYAGISGIDLNFEHMDLGEGIVLSKISAHVLNSYMVVFDQSRTEGSEILDVTDARIRKDLDGSEWENVTDRTEIVPAQQEFSITAQLYFPEGAPEIRTVW